MGRGLCRACGFGCPGFTLAAWGKNQQARNEEAAGARKPLPPRTRDVASFYNVQCRTDSFLLGLTCFTPSGRGEPFAAVPHLNLENFLVFGPRLAANAVFHRRARALLQPFLQRRFVVGA